MRPVTIENMLVLYGNIEGRDWDFLSNPVTRSQKRLYTYLKSYPEFIKYFERIKKIENHHLIIGANFTYGWMPTILLFKNNNSESVICNLNKLRAENYNLVENDVEEIRIFLNNSISGTTKLLHFIQPEKYPILDSKIYDYLGGSSTPTARDYIDYFQNSQNIITNPQFTKIHTHISDLIQRHFVCHITPCRAFELLMFLGQHF